MVQKVKRFLVFVLFSLVCTLIGGKKPQASSNIACIAPASNDKMLYNGSEVTHTLAINNDSCY